jgi:hypothetical protein
VNTPECFGNYEDLAFVRSARADPAPNPGDPGVTIGYPYRRLAEVMLPTGAGPSSFGQVQTSDSLSSDGRQA